MPMYWSEEEEGILCLYYQEKGSDFCDAVIFDMFGWRRGNRNIMQKAWKLGLRYQGPKRGVFKKGHAAFNKGRKMPAEVKEKVARTMFKKGHLPHNAKSTSDGCIRLRYDNRKAPVYFIRLALGKWEYLARHTWRQHHGEIPAGYIVTHKDGDSLNCDISNLKLISRAENARRNYSRDKFMAWHRELTDEYVLQMNNATKRSLTATMKHAWEYQTVIYEFRSFEQIGDKIYIATDKETITVDDDMLDMFLSGLIEVGAKKTAMKWS